MSASTSASNRQFSAHALLLPAAQHQAQHRECGACAGNLLGCTTAGGIARAGQAFGGGGAGAPHSWGIYGKTRGIRDDTLTPKGVHDAAGFAYNVPRTTQCGRSEAPDSS
jgi:hypothetical protein